MPPRDACRKSWRRPDLHDAGFSHNNRPVQRIILSAIDMAAGDIGQVQANLEAWFDSGMDRVSGWYKRYTQISLLWIGLILVIVADADCIRIANRFLVGAGGKRHQRNQSNTNTQDEFCFHAPSSPDFELSSRFFPTTNGHQ